jgi:class 3 adenylate cyclase/pimeloyl-ACP methyl ester carboxylesterase
MRPDTQFVQALDGTYVAYQVLGSGQCDLVVVMGGGLPIDDQMDGRKCASFIERLGSFARVIRLDRHGLGMSDPIAGEDTLEQWVEDTLLVLDAVGSERAAFFGPDGAGAAVSMMFAASHPERVTHLALVNARARFLRADDYPWGWDVSELDDRLDQIVTSRLAGTLPFFVPSHMSSDEEFVAWHAKAQRRGLSPLRSRLSYEAMWRTDLRPVLSTITAPTLLITSQENADSQHHASYIAERLEDARIARLPVSDGFAFFGDTDVFVGEVEEFVTGARSHGPQDRVLATVLFSDIVDSTALAAALGDQTWRDRLDAHDAMVRRKLEQFRGREVKTTGDGFVATFDGPARAIHCARAIRDGATPLDLSVRIGLHTGEVELRGDDIGGISVHTAARVEEQAGPDQICVSRTVVDLVAGSGLTFDDLGEHTLKGIPGSWRLFAVDA